MIRLATDVGGTFTDLVAWDEATDELTVAKDLTTPRDQSDGVMSVVRLSGLEPTAIAEFVHGGTTVINAITERKGVRTALITTEGFRDVLAIGRGNRPDLYNLQFEVPEPFIPRRWRFEVPERLDAEGQVVKALDLDSLEHIAQACRRDGIEAVAVCFLHAYRNPVHEQACGARLAELLPDVALTLSSDFTREWREYERTSTAALNACVQPIIQRYFDRLEGRLRELGVRAPLQAMQSNGGTTSFASARAHPLTLVESGPAAGVNGAVIVGRAAGLDDLIAFDVGGTTAKCSLIRGGMATVNTDYWIEKTRFHPGYPVKAPVTDIVEVGAGGGSIARIDTAGRLKVGPQSAGADPGPACYGVGGTEPTVTDAMLLTGVLDNVRFSDGRLTLLRDRAEAAYRPIADALDMPIVEAAASVIRLAEANMINALKLISVQRGHDPRDFAMLAYGGGGAMHAAALGRELGVKEVVIPRHPGLFSAWGMLATSPRHDQVRTDPVAAESTSGLDLQGTFAQMIDAAVGYFGLASADGLEFTARIDLRYHGQEHTVAVAVDPRAIDMTVLIEHFHIAHKRAYTFRLDDAGVEIIHFHLASERKGRVPEIRRLDRSTVTKNQRTPKDQASSDEAVSINSGNATSGHTGSLDAALLSARDVHFGDQGLCETRIFNREALPQDQIINGPAIVLEPTSTTRILPGQNFRMDAFGMLRIVEADA